MKKITFYLIVVVIALTTAIVACSDKDNNISVIAVTLNENTLTLDVNDTETLVHTVLPETATNKAVIWESGNTLIATVNSNGLVTANSAGTTTITVITVDGNKTATCTLTVKIPLVSVTGVALSWATASMEVNDTYVLTATVEPEDATNKNLTWLSSSAAVATVNSGTITATGLGTAAVTVITEEGNRTAICVVSVVGTPDLTESGVNNNTPGWGTNLGVVSFASTQTWTVGSQTWSDAVQATNCNSKTTYNGGTLGDYNADCRSNPGYSGNFFSWGAVVRYRKQLCPDGWRVPSNADFAALDLALGGTGATRYDVTVRDKYLNATIWGGEYGGACLAADGTPADQNTHGNYWSVNEFNQSTAYMLVYTLDGYVLPMNVTQKGIGVTLRCVR
ncbi:MAG: Ig-like domain-containing protein [Bacteroidales bacterium]|nr:Ig-like domain-containing protein [Bacteroidales bacterium]MCL2133255.1 Ig-like domain-containing protein [Bacteroidales bacterium]